MPCPMPYHGLIVGVEPTFTASQSSASELELNQPSSSICIPTMRRRKQGSPTAERENPYEGRHAQTVESVVKNGPEPHDFRRHPVRPSW